MLVFVFFYGYGDPRDLQVLTHFSLHDALPILRLDDLPCERQSQPEPAIRGSAAIGGGAIEGMADRLAAHAGAVVRNDDPRRMIVAVGVQQHAPALGTAGLGEGAVGALVQMATGVGQLSFSRPAEAGADRLGLESMARAGYASAEERRVGKEC